MSGALCPLAAPAMIGPVGVGTSTMATIADLQAIKTGWMSGLLNTLQMNVAGGALKPLTTASGTILTLNGNLALQVGTVNPGWLFGQGGQGVDLVANSNSAMNVLNPANVAFGSGGGVGNTGQVCFQDVEMTQFPYGSLQQGKTWEARFLAQLSAWDSSGSQWWWPIQLWGSIVATGLAVQNGKLTHTGWTMTLYWTDRSALSFMPGGLISPGSGDAFISDPLMAEWLTFSNLYQDAVRASGILNGTVIGSQVYTGTNAQPPESIDLEAFVLPKWGTDTKSIFLANPSTPFLQTPGHSIFQMTYLGYQDGSGQSFDVSNANAAYAHSQNKFYPFSQLFPGAKTRQGGRGGLSVVSLLSKI